MKKLNKVLKVTALAVLMLAGSAHAAGKYVLITHGPDSDASRSTST